MRKLTSIAALLAMTLGFVACNKENAQPEPGFKALAYMSVALQMPKGVLRADGQDQNAPASNFVGKWAGKDKIEKVDIYVVPTDPSKTIEKYSDLNYAEYYNDPTQAPGSDNVVLTPKKAHKVGDLAGAQVKVYVLINAHANARTILESATTANFEQKYKEAIEVLASTDATASSAKSEGDTAGGKLAKKNGTGSTATETIMMTSFNPSDVITLEKGTTENEAITGVKNQAKVNVERTVARVMVSVAQTTFEIKDKVDTNRVLGEIKDLHYVIAQGERQVYIQRQPGDNNNPSWKTLGTGFVPGDGSAQYHSQATQYYDYSSLWVDYDASKISSGTIIPTIAQYSQNLTTVTDELNKGLSGKFLLPNTHVYASTREASGYRKGNTPYILVRGTFVPKAEIFADRGKTPTSGGAPIGDYVEGNDFYVGTNGKFYTSADNARDPKTGGVIGMQSNKYEKGKVLYFAWLNPDKTSDKEWINSPVVRNNIYHVHISGFKSIGVNWNPLVPDSDPSNPANPNNPDPNPNEPGHDPNDNPIKPEDPLSNDETYMSVEVTVLPWLVHSYSIQLGF